VAAAAARAAAVTAIWQIDKATFVASVQYCVPELPAAIFYFTNSTFPLDSNFTFHIHA
jgi:hypothetical protein